jgi:hypothetical protein
MHIGEILFLLAFAAGLIATFAPLFLELWGDE